MVAEIKLAIEATAQDGWRQAPSEGPDFEFRIASSQGWTLLIGYGGDRQDGTATKGGTIIHLTSELVALARQKAEGQA